VEALNIIKLKPSQACESTALAVERWFR